MEDRLKKIEAMIKNYNKDKKQIEKKYDKKELLNQIADIDKQLNEPVKLIDREIENLKIEKSELSESEKNLIAGYDEKIQNKLIEREIEKLKREKGELPESEKDLIAEYDEKIQKEEKRINELYKNSYNDKNMEELFAKKRELTEKLKLIPAGKEAEKNKNMELFDLENKQRASLTQEKNSIQNEIEKVELNMNMILMDIKDFKYEYEEIGDGVKVPKNGAEMRELNNKYQKQQDVLNNLKSAKSMCEKELDKFKQKDNEKAKKINEALKRNIPAPKQTNEVKDNKKEDIKEEIKPSNANVFEKNNTINNVINDMQRENRNYSNIHLTHDDLRQTPKVSLPKGIKYIEILENEGEIHFEDIDGNTKEISNDIVKKDLFKNTKINEICEEVAGSLIPSLFLRRRVNPNIVEVLKNNPTQLKEYITCLHDKKDLPFELVHNMEGLSIWKKFRLNKFVRLEEKLGGKILGKMFNKNRALKEGEKQERQENIFDKQREEADIARKIEKAKSETLGNENRYHTSALNDTFLKNTGRVEMAKSLKVENPNNIIEDKAVKKVLSETQEEMASDVKKIMQERDSGEEK